MKNNELKDLEREIEHFRNKYSEVVSSQIDKYLSIKESEAYDLSSEEIIKISKTLSKKN